MNRSLGHSGPLHVDLTDGPIDVPALLPLIADPDVGAHAWFIGVTRRTTSSPDDPEQKLRTATLHYEAQRTMALSELESLGRDAIGRFALTALVMVHRLGRVPIGEACVVVGCSSPHRADSLDALPWVMAALKRSVPIWKQESYEDGQTQWVHPARPETS